MASKTATTEPPKEEPAAKKAKVEEEEQKEQEQDDSNDTRPANKEKIGFNPVDTTLNTVLVHDGKMLMAMGDGGMQFLIAGARANIGLKSGRYFYEARIVESLSHYEGQHNRNQAPTPKQLVKVGFSTAGSSLLLGDTVDSVGFDNHGFFFADKKSQRTGQTFGKCQTIGVLLNLDAKSPNANTVSLFRDGVRVGKPQPLPDHLKGKALFPHVSFRNVSVQMNFGANALAPLPFKCRMLQQAAKADLQDTKAAAPKDGKYDVLFPVGFPDEGTFTWLDMFLEKNPQYTEISDRAIHNWIVKSGMWKPQEKRSLDKPEYNFGLGLVDDGSIRRAILTMAPLVPRHYIVMEVKQNLVAGDRTENLKRFNLPHFKKIAKVMMGEPKPEYKERVHVQVLQDKQQRSDREWRQKKAEKERKKQEAKRKKELEAKKKAAAEEAQKRREAAEAKRKELAEKKKAEEEAKKKAAGEGDGEKKDEEKKDEEKKEEEKKDVEMKTEEKKEEVKEEAKEELKEEEPEEDDDMGTEPPKVELTDEDKKINFRPGFVKDLHETVLNKFYGEFSIPEKDEGFDDIQFEWQNKSQSTEYLKKWRQEKKLNTTISDLQPGEWFKTTYDEFQKTTDGYRVAQKAYKAKKPAEKKPAEGEEKPEQKDLFEVTDVNDIGNGEPLFANFTFEDWAMFSLRYELQLLAESFKKDVNDAERVGIPEGHIAFYYTRYFKKSLSPKLYGKDNIKDLCELVKETVAVENGLLAIKLADGASREIADFLKIQEEGRRERQRRIDAGDESVRIKFDGLEKHMEAEKQRVIKAAAEEERKKKLLEDNKKRAEEAAAKGKSDGDATGKPAPAKWNSGAGKTTSGPAKWNSGASKQAAWGNDKAGKGGGKGRW